EPMLLSMSKQQRKEFTLYSILPILSLTQYRASQYLQTRRGNSYVGRNVFDDRALEEKIMEYYSKVSPMAVEEQKQSFASAYIKLIGKALQGKCVSFGDLSPRNILISKGGQASIIDPEHLIMEANEFSNLGSFLAYSAANLDASDWNDLALASKKIMLENEIYQNKGELSLINLNGRKIFRIGGAWKFLERTLERVGFGASVPPTEEGEKQALFDLYGNIFHYSFRIMAKNTESHRYPDTKQEEKNLETILREFMTMPKKFGISEEERRYAITLYDRVIPQELEPDKEASEEEGRSLTITEPKTPSQQNLNTVAS
ncbi:MAG: hypothetical protein AABX71_01530, partial [Nanoarchaeota archaeon]